MFNQKKIDNLTDRLNKSGNEVQRLQNEIKKLKGETMSYTLVPTSEERVKKFLGAAARLSRNLVTLLVFYILPLIGVTILLYLTYIQSGSRKQPTPKKKKNA